MTWTYLFWRCETAVGCNSIITRAVRSSPLQTLMPPHIYVFRSLVSRRFGVIKHVSTDRCSTSISVLFQFNEAHYKRVVDLITRPCVAQLSCTDLDICLYFMFRFSRLMNVSRRVGTTVTLRTCGCKSPSSVATPPSAGKIPPRFTR